jgi:hypothetical protein
VWEKLWKTLGNTVENEGKTPFLSKTAQKQKNNSI